ncbi:MAG: hypothetical protein ACKO57_07965 [Alphaproteobacteria bacterium]
MLSRKAFLGRMASWLGMTFLVMGVSLGVGMVGYHIFESMPWVDAFFNAAMILGGMGPAGTLTTDAGKIFAGLYALYCGILLLFCGGLLLVPVFHRVLHYFHGDR